MPEPQPEATPPADRPAPPGVPDGPDAPPTRPAPPRVTGSAAVPPTEPKRRRWRGAEDATAGPVAPPPRDPTLRLPADELDDPETRTPVDPWAGADVGPWEAPAPHSPAPHSPAPQPSAPHSPAPQPPWPAPQSPPPAPYPPAAVSGYPPAYPPAPRHPTAAPPPALGYPPTTGYPPAIGYPPTPVPAQPVPGREKRRRDRGRPADWRPPVGYPPARPRRRRTWPGVMLTLTLLTVACCCGVPAYLGKPMWEQYPASATLPAEVADLKLRDDTASERDAQTLAQEMRAAHWLAEDTFAGVYSAPGNKRITVFGATGFRLSPESDVEAEMTRLGEQFALTGVESVETGTRGEYQRCGVGRFDGTDVVVCAWADHGSIAAGVFTRLSVQDSARLLAELRTWIVQRG
nr:hypothetical protein [Micromonospora sp. DSM 115978]